MVVKDEFKDEKRDRCSHDVSKMTATLLTFSLVLLPTLLQPQSPVHLDMARTKDSWRGQAKREREAEEKIRQEEEKTRQRKERNREAARKCMARKRQRLRELPVDFKERKEFYGRQDVYAARYRKTHRGTLIEKDTERRIQKSSRVFKTRIGCPKRREDYSDKDRALIERVNESKRQSKSRQEAEDHEGLVENS
ncbi:hypothetical protein BDZ89DRAFT_1054808 [Hymenopellis radicata]|nr:hypothetical protein BDZ89DRAFT_1054808 [Hymenopellis radicata]